MTAETPSARIVWAEDDVDMREYVAGLLRQRFEVQCFADGQAALEAVHLQPPDLVLSDVLMPRMDGVSLLRALRDDPKLRDIPMILLSARADEAARIEGLGEGADDYLIKPFSGPELVARVDAHARLARLRREATEALRRAHDDLEARVAARTLELAQSNERLRAEACERQRAESVRGALLRKLTTAQEDERRRISRELHDGLGQEITALILGLKLLGSELAVGSLGEKRLREIELMVGRLGQEAHALAVELRPPALDDIGLDAALTAYAEQWSKRTGVDADFQPLGLHGQRLPPELETAVYRVVQEALNNVAKHARARRVSVIVERRGAELTALVEDDGRGFDPEQEQSERGASRLGLLGMRERVSHVGGTFCIESSQGGGTTVRARIPLVAAGGAVRS